MSTISLVLLTSLVSLIIVLAVIGAAHVRYDSTKVLLLYPIVWLIWVVGTTLIVVNTDGWQTWGQDLGSGTLTQYQEAS